jgi:ATP-binding cassette subfamily C (CFTR/MRP) protein 10
VNRFSSDQYSIDDSLPFIANILLATLVGILGTLVVLCYSTPLIIVVYLPIGALYYWVQKYYRQTSRELKRLDSISRSPIYAHFSESINGVSVIRAFSAERRFREVPTRSLLLCTSLSSTPSLKLRKENKQRLDTNQRASCI